MFFRYFPTISYKVDNYNSVITDITVAFLQKRLYLNYPYKFRKYTILEGETPEAVSDKLYGTSKYHWAIMLLNNVVNPAYDWFMSSELLLNFTEAKYPEIENDITRRSGIYGINHFRFYYNEDDSRSFFVLDDVDDYKWRYKGGRHYTYSDSITISEPDLPDSQRATARINRIGELGEIVNIVMMDKGSGYTNTPTFTIDSLEGNGLVGEFILSGEEVDSFRILPEGEQIFPITNLHHETELNINRQEIIAITKEKILFFEEQLYKIMGSY